MGYHVYIKLEDLPKEGMCQGRELLESINRKSPDRPEEFKAKAMDIRECFICKSLDHIESTGYDNEGQKKVFELSCEEKDDPIPIVVE